MCSAVLSVANGGNSRYLIHSVVLGGPAEKLASNIEDAMSAVMTIARPQKEMITSMAMPLIGFGEFGSLSATAAAIALLSGINNFNRKHYIKEIKIVIAASPEAVDEVNRVIKCGEYINSEY